MWTHYSKQSTSRPLLASLLLWSRRPQRYLYCRIKHILNILQTETKLLSTISNINFNFYKFYGSIFYHLLGFWAAFYVCNCPNHLPQFLALKINPSVQSNPQQNQDFLFCVFCCLISLPELWLWDLRLDDQSDIACRLVDLQFVYFVKSE